MIDYELYNNHRDTPSDKSPRLLATGLVVIIVSTMIFALIYASRHAEKYAPLQDAAVEIKLEAAIGHLWFEKTISGNRNEDIAKVWQHIDQSAWYADAMLFGGSTAEGHFVPLKDPVLREVIEGVLSKLEEFKAIAEQRWQAKSESGVSSAIGQRFNAVFESLITQADRVETALQEKMRSDLRDFKLLQIITVLITLLLTFIVGKLLLRYEKQQLTDLKVMAEYTEIIKAIADYTYDWESWMGADGKVMWINPAVKKITGFSVADCQEMPNYPFTLIHHEDKPFISELLTDTIKNESVLDNVDFRILQKSGTESWVSMAAQAIYDSDQNYTGQRISIRDITQKIEAEKQIRELNTNLEQKVDERTLELKAANDKLKELDHLKSMFIASMSHELRTPLNSIIGFSGMIAGDMAGEITVQQRDFAQRINRAGQHLLELITEVIDISKIEAGKLAVVCTDFNLREVISKALEIIEPDIKAKGLSLELDVDEEIAMHNDKKRVYQCLINLLNNATKYTESGSITLITRSSGQHVEIIVKDTGIGISAGDVQRLFQPFIRLDTPLNAVTSGTGLGLYLIRKLAREVLGGDILVSSRESEGSQFTLRVPLQSDIATQKP